MGKLTRPQIWIIFGVLSLIAAITLWFTLNDPRNKETAQEESRRESRQLIADTKPQVDRAFADAKVKVAEAKRDWGIYEKRFMPPINVSNLYTAWQQIQKEQLYVLGPMLDRFVRSDKAVQIVQAGFSLYPPPDDPNQANAPLLSDNKGTVTVSGNFDAVLKHVERWNNFGRLVLITGFNLSGNSPRLLGSYNLQVFEFTQGETPGPTFPAASAGAGGGMGRGGFSGGGMGGGMGMSGSLGMSGSMGPGMGGPMPSAPSPGGGGGGAPLN